MPGISLHFYSDTESAGERDFRSALENVRHYPEYISEILIEQKGLQIAATCYPCYPIRKFEIDNIQIIIEGRIYNKDEEQIRADLSELAQNAFSTNKEHNAVGTRIKAVLADYDGEFLIIILDKSTGNLLLMNDTLGKLPLYYCHSRKGLTLSREITFVRQFNSIRRFNPRGLAYFLMLKYYPLGLTPFREIQKFPAGSYLLMKQAGNDPKIHQYFIPDLSEDKSSGNPDIYACELANELASAVRCRSKGNSHISALALSGGLDSRLVLAAFKHISAPCRIYSSLNSDRGNLLDIEVAGECAKLAGYEFNRIDLPESQFNAIENLAKWKSGLNNAYMAVAFGLYEKIIAELGWGADFYTGDGGASVKTPYRMKGIINTTKDLERFIFDAQACFDDAAIEKLLDVDCRELREDFIEQIKQFPADSINDRYLHYIVSDYLTHFGYEGEDRSRMFHWIQTPCESSHFYLKALKTPDKAKMNLKLIYKMLDILHAPLTGPIYADYSSGINSPKTRMALRSKRLAYKYPRLLRLIRKIRGQKNRGRPVPSYPHSGNLMALADSSELVNQTLNWGQLKELLTGRFNNLQYYHLLTLLLAIKSVENSQD